jgi:ketosteroid isomerase-like protein
MTPDCIFIDAYDNVISGKDAIVQAWIGYFKMFPDYLIETVEILEGDSSYAIFGYAGATYKNLKDENNSTYFRAPAAWKVIVENNHIKHWQVYADNVRAIEIHNRNEPFIRELKPNEISYVETGNSS